jgi:cell fate regulator YaaT (PSP1 superfamily)
MCWLRYENEVYVEAAKNCPKVDMCVMTPQGKGIVTEVNVLCGKCKVKLDSDSSNILPFSVEELKVLPKPKKGQNKSKEEKTEKESEAQ